ncbi:nuclear transport factor 2 family protein [Streptomyces himalayensis]|uniref:Nuclear transport factor 2 family protein n=2 Tax=Streptomyces himalayensis TaxID=2820085 RepID=A0A7W2D682_9ACTN|nr:nuclear transport factor 2 family protein [Streptomyces himalayensis]MBA2951381.1 nuclear transport factor 2 family protein [Streptomyces himalayensis subsp. himalayensis]MBA4865406.1 nuclear transport factor 2 family protein [Streptomyces himalayensis subsp. aureolus]
MTQTTETVVDRYITLVDRAVHEPEALQELESVFAPQATVQFGELPPVTGLADITEFYRRFYSDMADSKHVWTTTVLDDEGTIEVRFIAAWRTADGQLGSQGGIERVTVDADGLIRELRVLSLESDGA